MADNEKQVKQGTQKQNTSMFALLVVLVVAVIVMVVLFVSNNSKDSQIENLNAEYQQLSETLQTTISEKEAVEEDLTGAQNDLREAELAVTEAKAKVADLEGDIADLQVELAALNEENNANKERIVALNVEIEEKQTAIQNAYDGLNDAIAVLEAVMPKAEVPATDTDVENAVPVVTEEPAPEATEEPAPEATEEPAPVVTEEPAPEATEESAPEATEEPAPEATEESAPEATEEPAPEATEVPESVPVATMTDAALLDYVKVVTVKGYRSDVTVNVVLDENNIILSLAIDATGETEGLGQKVMEQEFLDQLIGKTLPVAIKAEGIEGIDAVANATMTTQAVVDALNSLVAVAE